MNDESNILMIGRVPPPIGGVTTFILRMMNSLNRKGHKVTLFPSKRGTNIQILYNLLIRNYDHIYVNSMSFVLLLFLALTFNLNKVELVDHNHSRHFGTGIRKKFLILLLRFTFKISLVDEHLRVNYPEDFKNLDLINPFIPPSEDEIRAEKKNIPQKISSFVNDYENILVISAWRYIYENNIDLYGLERTLDLFIQNESSLRSTGLVICLGDIDFNKEKVSALKHKAKYSSSVVFWDNCFSSWSLFSKKTLYLRPTSTDGNSISLQEALYFGSKVLTSDVVPRLEGCNTFAFESNQDYESKIFSILGIYNETNTTKYS